MNGCTFLILCICVGCPLAFIIIGGLWSEWKYTSSLNAQDNRQSKERAESGDSVKRLRIIGKARNERSPVIPSRVWLKP